VRQLPIDADCAEHYADRIELGFDGMFNPFDLLARMSDEA